jgi:lysozyme family protein
LIFCYSTYLDFCALGDEASTQILWYYVGLLRNRDCAMQYCGDQGSGAQVMERHTEAKGIQSSD